MRREEVYIQTKFTPLSGHNPRRIPYDPAASPHEQVAQSFAASLRNLQTTYVDALILHSPMSREEQTLEVWRAMEALVDSGGARRIGISNCYQLDALERLHHASRIKPAIVQNRFYAETGYDQEIRRFCPREGLMYQSFWTLTANPHLLADETVRLLFTKYRRTPAQVLFRYLTQVGVTPLTGPASEAHMREDLAIFEFELTASELGAVSVLL